MLKTSLGLLLAVGLAGCGSSQPEASAQTTRAVMSALAELDSLNERAGGIEARLVLLCLEGKGFLVHPPTPKALPDSHVNERLALSPTVAEARRDGYGLDSRKPVDTVQKIESSEWDQQSQDYIERYTLARSGSDDDVVEHTFEGGMVVSDPASGCIAEVRQKLYDDQKQYLILSFSLSNDIQYSVQDALKSSALQESLTKWSTCMAGKGYSGIQTPNDAYRAAERAHDGEHNGQPAEASDHEVAKEIEKSIATADAECASESNLNETFIELERREMGKLYAKYEKDVYAFVKDQKVAIERGAHLLKVEPRSGT